MFFATRRPVLLRARIHARASGPANECAGWYVKSVQADSSSRLEWVAGGSLTMHRQANLVNYTALPYNRDMEFIEASAFTKYVYAYLSEDEYAGLQSFLFLYPEAGKVVPGSGGVRKLRWGAGDLLLQTRGC